MKRTIFLQLEVDWEEFTYEGISDDILLKDTGILDNLKDGVVVKRIPDPNQLRLSFNSPNSANPNFVPYD